MASEIVVCVTCRPAGEPREGQAAGRSLFEHIEDEALRTDSPCAVRAVECMSACSHNCTVALHAVGKTSYLFGDLPADAETATQVVLCAGLHTRSADGLVAWAERPERLQRSILARLPAPVPMPAVVAVPAAAPLPTGTETLREDPAPTPTS